MNGKRKVLAVFLAVFALGAGNLWGEIIMIGLTGEIDYVSDYEGLLQGRLNVGDIITGSYTYDSDTLDTHPGPEDIGHYWHYSPPYGIRLTAGGFVFQTDPDNVEFVIAIGNDYYGDDYLVRSYNNLPIDDDLVIDHIAWHLDDNSGTALSTDALPTTPPVLEDYPDTWFGLVIEGCKFRPGPHMCDDFYIRANVTSVEIIPEPATVLLFALGSLAMLRPIFYTCKSEGLR